MSMFSDVGKTVSAACGAARMTAELIEKTMDDKGLIGGVVTKSAEIMDATLSNVVEQTKMEGELDMLEFQAQYQTRKKELEGK